MKQITLNIDAGESTVRLQGLLYEVSREMPQRQTRPCVIICPGGGYAFRSAREADPIAAQFSAAGYHTFILEYSVRPSEEEDPLRMKPLSELACAVSAVRARADEFGISSIAVCGFSAGGHLAASLGVHWMHDQLRGCCPDAESCRPDAMVLAYPVISSDERIAHSGSIVNLAGDDEELREFFSLECHVGPQTAPAFVWHTVTDDAVPVENSLRLITAMKENHVPFECHLFGEGGHGMSLCTYEVGSPNRHNAAWMQLCIEWLDERFGFVRG